ncbi:hypothetical protein [Streptomyces sp. RKAG290]|uniref:hypothetical protein n=1 Tax=Streptomyces sp. RKAG290 TaxID=2888348 RepID=UPI0020341628|nr:hypothetical protein [Streptomyces sp. RKAG290]MCM2413901.1 hypothetical protein [Streptomyces sp. RKAG290]
MAHGDFKTAYVSLPWRIPYDRRRERGDEAARMRSAVCGAGASSLAGGDVRGSCRGSLGLACVVGDPM